MKNRWMTWILCAAWMATAHADEPANAWTIFPGVNAGPITARTTEGDLIRLYGKDNVRLADLPVGGGKKEQGALIFPEDLNKTLAVFWANPKHTGVKQVRLTMQGSLWKTDRGVTIGTNLETLEELNKKPFVMTGFGWDMSGSILHGDGGEMKELGVPGPKGVTGRTLLLRLAPKQGRRTDPIYDGVVGEKSFPSSHPSLKKLNPLVYEIIVPL